LLCFTVRKLPLFAAPVNDLGQFAGMIFVTFTPDEAIAFSPTARQAFRQH